MLPIHFNTNNLLLIIYFFRFLFSVSQIIIVNANSLKAADQWLTNERRIMQKKARPHNKVAEKRKSIQCTPFFVFVFFD
jgi:hypothetical protein